MTMERSDHPTVSSDAIEKPPVSPAPNTGSESVKPAAGSAAADNAGNTGEGVNTRGSAASQGGDGDGATINALELTQIGGTADRNGHAPLERHIFSRLMGEPTQLDIDRAMARLEEAGGPVLIYRHEGKVLHDWREYLAAQRLGLRLVFSDVETDDPQGFLIGLLFDVRGWAKYQRAALVVLMRSWRGPGRPRKAANDAEFTDATAKPMTVAEMAAEAKVCHRYIYMAKRVHRHDGEETLRRVIPGQTFLASVDKRYRTPRKNGEDGNKEQTRAADALDGQQSDCNNVGRAELMDQDQAAAMEAGPNAKALVLDLTRQVNRLRRENRRLKEGNRLLTRMVGRLRGHGRSAAAIAARKSEQHTGFAAEHRSGGADHESDLRPDARTVDVQMRLIE